MSKIRCKISVVIDIWGSWCWHTINEWEMICDIIWYDKYINFDHSWETLDMTYDQFNTCFELID